MKDIKLPNSCKRNTMEATDWIFQPPNSFQEAGIFIFLVAYGDSPMSTQHIANHSGDGYNSTLIALQSLEKKGYIEYSADYEDGINEYAEEYGTEGVLEKGVWQLTAMAASASYKPYLNWEECNDFF